MAPSGDADVGTSALWRIRASGYPPGRPVSRLFVVLTLADDIGDVVVSLFLFLDEGGIVEALVDLDILFGSFGRLRALLALGLGVSILERHELSVLGLRHDGLFLTRRRRPRGGRRFRTRPGRQHDRHHGGVAFRADDRVLVQVVELHAATATEALGAELGFRHGPVSLGRSLKFEVLHLASRARPVNSEIPPSEAWGFGPGDPPAAAWMTLAASRASAVDLKFLHPC